MAFKRFYLECSFTTLSFWTLKGSEVLNLELSEELDEFRKALYDLLYTHAEVDVETIYSQLGYKYQRYYDVLQDIHGDRTDKLQRGHCLFMRFPILSYSPRHEFVRDCIDHFVHDLEIEQMINDLNRLKSVAISDANFEVITNRIGDLKREIHRSIDEYNATGSRLAEEATEYRRLGRTLEKPMPAVQLTAIPAY